MDEIKLTKTVFVMTSEPVEGADAEEFRKEAMNASSEQDIAALFAAAWNEAWWVEDDIYDYEAGTPEYNKACEITKTWFSISDILEQKIFAILQSEGTEIPKTGQIKVLIPFMERNSFFDGNGWWLKKD